MARGARYPAPARNIREMAAQVMALDLTDDEKEQILAGNARAFLGL